MFWLRDGTVSTPCGCVLTPERACFDSRRACFDSGAGLSGQGAETKRRRCSRLCPAGCRNVPGRPGKGEVNPLSAAKSGREPTFAAFFVVFVGGVMKRSRTSGWSAIGSLQLSGAVRRGSVRVSLAYIPASCGEGIKCYILYCRMDYIERGRCKENMLRNFRRDLSDSV